MLKKRDSKESLFFSFYVFVIKGYYDYMPYGISKKSRCLECNEEFPHLKKLSEHIKKIHKISPQDYCVKYQYNNSRPMCVTCGGETRYVSLSEGFKKYCVAHKNIASAEAGKIGGKIKKQWNKGKTKETDERLLKFSANMSGEGNHFYGRKHTDLTKEKNATAHRLNFSEVVNQIAKDVPNITVLSDWRSYNTQDSLLHVKCNQCESEDDVSLFNIKRCWRCRKCNPIGSRQQIEVSEYVRSLGFDVEISTRKIIPPLELDIWIPEKSVAIEYHGLYWHSGGREETFDKRKHRKKYESATSSKIKLIQIFSDEWIKKKDICKSIIRNALGKNSVKLNARDCSLVDLSKETAEEFLERTHISGYTRCKHRIGLFHKIHGLVGIATTRTPIQKRWGNICELARMSFSENITVRGGASKLLSRVKELAIHDGFEGVLSYADLRFGSGSVYEKCGFKLEGESTINYWYTDGHSRFDRFSFRAQPGKPENEVAKEEGVKPVWGAGNKIFIWRP